MGRPQKAVNEESKNWKKEESEKRFVERNNREERNELMNKKGWKVRRQSDGKNKSKWKSDEKAKETRGKKECRKNTGSKTKEEKKYN